MIYLFSGYKQDRSRYIISISSNDDGTKTLIATNGITESDHENAISDSLLEDFHPDVTFSLRDEKQDIDDSDLPTFYQLYSATIEESLFQSIIDEQGITALEKVLHYSGEPDIMLDEDGIPIESLTKEQESFLARAFPDRGDKEIHMASIDIYQTLGGQYIYHQQNVYSDGELFTFQHADTLSVSNTISHMVDSLAAFKHLNHLIAFFRG